VELQRELVGREGKFERRNFSGALSREERESCGRPRPGSTWNLPLSLHPQLFG